MLRSKENTARRFLAWRGVAGRSWLGPGIFESMKTRPFFWVVTALAAVELTLPAAEPRLDLSGQVSSTDGRTLTNASVFIYTAGPRVGVGFL